MNYAVKILSIELNHLAAKLREVEAIEEPDENLLPQIATLKRNIKEISQAILNITP